MTITEAAIRGDTLVYWIIEESTNEWRREGLVKLAAIQRLEMSRTKQAHGVGAPEAVLLELHTAAGDVLHLWFAEPGPETDENSNPYNVASRLFSVLTQTIQGNDREVAT